MTNARIEIVICHVLILSILTTSIQGGCYSPLTLNQQRTQAGVAVDKDNNRIYFAAGTVNRDTVSKQVDVLDLSTNTWSSFELPAALRRTHVFVYDSRVIFVGSATSNGQPRIEIYFPSNGTFQTIPIGYSNYLTFSSVVVGSMAYIYSTTMQRSHVIALDLTTNTITRQHIPLALTIDSAATNGTHFFILQNEAPNSFLYHLSLETWQEGGSPVNLNLPPSRHMFMVDNETLILLAVNQIAHVDLRSSSVYSSYQSIEMAVQGATKVGSEIYVFSPAQLSVISTLRSEVTQYQMPGSFFRRVSAAAELNGLIYFTAEDSTASVLTVNTNALFRSYDAIQLQSQMDVAINGFNFVIPRGLNVDGIRYIELSTGQVFWHNFTSYEVFNHFTIVSVDNTRLVLLRLGVGVYDMFDTVTETWSSEKIPSSINPHLIPTSLNDLAVFQSRDFCYIFNTTSREWTSLAVKGTAVKAVGESLVIFSEDWKYHSYNVYSRQWISNVSRPIPSRHVPTIGTHQGLLFEAGGISGTQYLDDVTIFNTADGSIKHLHLSAPRAYVEFVGVGDHVIFASGESPTMSSAIDVLNIVTFQWHTLSLHRTPLGRVAMTPLQNSVFFTLPHAVEFLDITSMTLQQMPIPFTFPLPSPGASGGSFGSKVVLFGTTLNGLSVTFYETSTRISTSISIRVERQYIPFLTMTHNFLIAVVNGVPKVFQFSTTENELLDTQLFYGDITTFDVTARGIDLTSQWYHNAVLLLGETQTTLNVSNVTQSSEGIYSIRVVDQCNQVMTRQANLTVHGPPVIIDELTESIIMCHEMATIRAESSGMQRTYDWTIGSLTQTTNNSTITVTGEAFECNTSHQLCVSVINPSGSTSQCTTVRIVNHDSVFSGPRQLSSLPLLIRETDVDIEVSLLDDECDSHEWIVNGVKTGIRGERSSIMTVHLDQNTTLQSFGVIAQCGNSELTSRPFKFTNVSSLNVVWLVVLVVGCFLVLIGALLTAYFVRRRSNESRQAEIELESLLNQAKAETLNRDGVPILKSTTWEWSPNEQFTFKPINKMSFALDSTALASLNKHEPVKVGVWNQNIISFSSRGGSNNSKTKRTNMLKERLIGGTHIDIYAPQLPKYEIKIEPSSFDIDDSDTPVHVTVSSMMRITAKCKVGLIVVCEQEQVYSIVEFKLTSAMSTWIDLDEIEMTGDYLGGGGFGSVTRGVYRGQEVAVKKLLSQYLTPEMHIEFEREIMLMKDLHHPNIVQFVGASNIKDSLAIVIEYAPLGSLASVIEKHSLPLNMKMTMLLESAKALQFLHANGIIHRDIKPQNILVFSLEPKSPVHIKLTDFGTARFISEEAMTVTKNIGTTCFMAPESLGKNPRIEKSADVYSFALLMWSVLFEQTPFSEFKWDSDLEAHVKQGHRLPFPSDQNVDGALISLISECWEHEPNKRPSMATVVQRLTVLSSTLK